jgi:hypothetical protein
MTPTHTEARLTHEQLWGILRGLRPGRGVEVGGAVVYRVDGTTWTVGGGEARSLLVSIDEVRRLVRERQEAPGSSAGAGGPGAG